MSRFESARKKKFGETWLAEDKDTKQKVIVKYVAKSLKNQKAIEQLRSEHKFQFTETCLQSSLYLIEDEKGIALIKTFIEGATLADYWKSVKRKDKFTALKELVEKCIPAFELLREKEIIHADIKPANIIVKTDRSKSVESVSFIDFGLAFEKSEIPNRKTLFALGFSAPELILNRLYLANHTTDLYSFGIVLYTLLESEIPNIHPNPSITTNLQLNLPLPSLSRKYKNLQISLDKLTLKHAFKIPPNRMDKSEVDKQLKKAISDRYSSLTQFYEQFPLTKRKSWF